MAEITTDEGLLRKLSKPVEKDEIAELIQELKESLPEKALGLAAPQINIHKRMFIANLSTGCYVFCNPEITKSSPNKIPSIESCLSLPGVERCIERHSQVTIEAEEIRNVTEFSLQYNAMQLSHLDAFIVQHETDHLNGVLITDHSIVKTNEQRFQDREQKRKQRINAARIFKNQKVSSHSGSEKPAKKRTDKMKRDAKKKKRQARTFQKQQKISVEIQERYKAEKKGLFEVSPPQVSNE